MAIPIATDKEMLINSTATNNRTPIRNAELMTMICSIEKVLCFPSVQKSVGRARYYFFRGHLFFLIVCKIPIPCIDVAICDPVHDMF